MNVVRYAEVFWDLGAKPIATHNLNALAETHEQNPLKTYVLSVLHSGERALLDLDGPQFNNFQMEWGLENTPNPKLHLKLHNAPSVAFDSSTKTLREEVKRFLFAVLRDVLFMQEASEASPTTTERIVAILRNAPIGSKSAQGFVVCWGGHNLPESEYLHTKEVGRALGSEKLDLCTGSGAGAMQGPMEGRRELAAQAKGNVPSCVGLVDVQLLRVEAPNPLVTDLVLMPSREMRLEAFLRLARGFVVFPGGVGTMEELSTLLGVASCPENATWRAPITLTASRNLRPTLEATQRFLRQMFGEQIESYYKVVVGEPASVASTMKEAASQENDCNSELYVPKSLQEPFVVSRESAADLFVARQHSILKTAVLMRKVFAVLVATSVDKGLLRDIRLRGPVVFRGEANVINATRQLHHRMVREGFLHQGKDEPQRVRFVAA